MEVKYHARCLVSLYNKVRSLQATSTNEYFSNEGMAIAQVVDYIQVDQKKSEKPVHFLLSKLSKLSQQKLKDLGMSQQLINSHHLKNRMLALYPELKSYQEGKYVCLASGHDVANLLKETDYSHDEDALILLKAASILRRGMDKKNDWSLNIIGNVKSLIPKNLLFFISTLLYGTRSTKEISFEDISNSNNTAFDIPVISISQLIMSNSLSKPKSESSSSKIYRLNHKETPLTIYTGLLVHHQTRKRNIVVKLHSLGLSASYDRISQIETAVANDISFRFNLENVVCPTSFKVNLFTCGAIDNIDKNSSSSSTQ